MIELSKEPERLSAFAADLARWGRTRLYMRLSLRAFVKVALLDQGTPGLVTAVGFGEMMSAMYRDFRVKNKFWECV